MAIYSKTTKQMMVDLINAGNPQLPFPINETDFEFGLPEVIADPGNGHNTRIRITAKPNTNYVGNVQLTYRRLDVGRIFRNMTLEVSRWVANTGANGSPLILLSSLYPLYSEKYGFNFAVGEWGDGNLSGLNGIRGDVFNIAPIANNLAFVGNVQGKWTIGERTLESLLSVDVVAGRRYPGGNDFVTPGHKYWVTPDGFDMDFSAFKDTLESGVVATGYAGGIRANVYVGDNYADGSQPIRQIIENNILKTLKNRNGDFYTIVTAGGPAAVTEAMTTPFRLNGAYFRRYALPHADVPEANSEFYNRCLVISVNDAFGGLGQRDWGTGRILLHYNV
jgi:hypothetical protein